MANVKGWCGIAYVVGGLVLSADVARSQAPATTVRGTVRDAATGAPVSAATLESAGLGRTIVADDSGRFTIAEFPTRGARILVRHVGYAPLDTFLLLPRAAGETFTLRITRAATTLDTLQVKAKENAPLPMSATLPEFEARRARATGRFITAAELRKEDDRVLTDVLRSRLGGVMFEIAGDGVHAYNPAQQPPGSLQRSAPRKCYVQIVVDGNSIYQISMGSGDRPPDLAEYQTRGLDGVEYYASPSRTPAELRSPGAVCGTLVFWTRRR